MSRPITRRYADPLDTVWLAAARRIGLEVTRTEDAFATKDSGRRLAIATDGHLDPDDCLAQMIFHELCHSLVEGPESFERADWGLDPENPERERACLRAQAHLARRHGLAAILAPTTEHRPFYEGLGERPLEPRGEPSARLAIAAIRRAESPPWAPHLGEALAATRAIAAAAAAAAAPGDLLGDLEPAPASHPSGLPGASEGRCADCAWRGEDDLCEQAVETVDPSWPGCERFEPALDCLACAACCRSAYQSVTIEDDDPVVARHAELVVRRGKFLELRRQGEGDDDRCAALEPDWRCAIYGDRPRCCREFEVGGDHCLTARRRMDLSL